MKLGDAEYVAKVQALLNDGTCVSHSEARRRIAQTESGHKHTQLTESECKQEIEAITGGAKSSFEQRDKNGDLIDPNAPKLTQAEFTAKAMEAQAISIQPKKRGRPLGSRNKPKVNQGEVK